MGKLKVGQVVSCVFPFSDLSSKKLRPALIVAVVDFDDLILCQITSKTYSSSRSIALRAADFTTGNLPVDSFVRPDKLFTADAAIASAAYGIIQPRKLEEVRAAIRYLFTSSGA